jgi:predicted Mrr-cat superfamily restriction endonuclease
MIDKVESKVWGVFVGERGDQLEAFNSINGPFPPAPGIEGYIAIGWAGIGDMKMFKNNYSDYLEKFRILYPDENERVLKTQANIPWNFACVMNDGDFVICPSSASGYLLVGNIVGDYENDCNNWTSVAKSKTRNDLMHLRRVKWICSVPNDDPRYEKLHRIGQLTVVCPNLSTTDLINIINENN